MSSAFSSSGITGWSISRRTAAICDTVALRKAATPLSESRMGSPSTGVPSGLAPTYTQMASTAARAASVMFMASRSGLSAVMAAAPDLRAVAGGGVRAMAFPRHLSRGIVAPRRCKRAHSSGSTFARCMLAKGVWRKSGSSSQASSSDSSSRARLKNDVALGGFSKNFRMSAGSPSSVSRSSGRDQSLVPPSSSSSSSSSSSPSAVVSRE
jgi:hypothetical protein